VKWIRLPIADWPLAAAGAFLLVMSYPPFHFVIPSFICLIPAVWMIHAGQDDPRPFRRQMLQGFWFGWVSQALVLYWMVIALWHFTKLSAAGFFATVTILALETGCVFAFTGWVVRNVRWPIALVLPVAWTAMEWVIGHQGDIRFPWLGLGTSLSAFPVLVQIADVVGARGITFLLVAANTLLALAWLRRNDRRYAFRAAGTVTLGVIVAGAYGVFRARSLQMAPAGRVTAIQPAEFEKWSGSNDSIMTRVLALSQDALTATRPDLLAWPEASVPAFFVNRPDFEVRIREQVARNGIPVLVGGLDAVLRPDRLSYEYWNSAFLYDSNGARVSPVYHKQELVPIVERVPFVNPAWFSGIKFFGGFGKGEPGPIYRIPMGQFGVLICYESAFENLARDYRSRGADFLVNITNDSWFGRTSAPYQHAAHLVMRAIENRVGIARAANNGISEFVDPLGRVYHATRLDDTTFVTDTVFTTGTRTVYTGLGDWVGLLALAGSLVMVVVAWRKGGRPEGR
jgi:apolipoprotein N-acyltransferase